jgi:MFS family permease
MYIGVLENANSLANFQPTVLKGLGYTATQAQVHTIPVYVVGAVFTLTFSHLSEWFQRRYYFYMLGWATLATGLCIMIAYPASAKVRYMGMFFLASGCYLAMPVTVIWISVNAGSGYKRAVAIAAIINFGTAGALITSNVYLLRETPKFRTGFSTGFGLACLGAIAATVYWIGCQMENRRRDRKRLEMPEVLEGDVKDMGDAHPDFRYAL